MVGVRVLLVGSWEKEIDNRVGGSQDKLETTSPSAFTSHLKGN